jgi:toxoflavin synthase
MGKVQYDEIAEEYSQMLNPTKKHVLIPTFKKIIGSVSGKSILDLACGDGFFTRILSVSNPSKLTGIDISEELIQKANQIENETPLNIKYLVGDALDLKVDQKFNLITAVYLLNYSQTLDELSIMCKNIFNTLEDNGKFVAILLNPFLKPMVNFEYERRFTNVADKKHFEDGDRVKVELKEEGKTPFEFITYYWSKETFEKSLKSAGFKSIKWVDTMVSQEGINNFSEGYWDKFLQNPSPIGLICEK